MSRKATYEDIFGETRNDNEFIVDNVRIYKNQVDYSLKKFIKP